MRVVIFRCLNCGAVISYPERTSDGHRCKDCDGGFLSPIRTVNSRKINTKKLDDDDASSRSADQKELEQVAAMHVLSGLRWRGQNNFESILSYDKSTQEIVVSMDGLMKLLMIANPVQRQRRIRIDETIDRDL